MEGTGKKQSLIPLKPVYFQIATDIKKRIMRHEWNINEKLPTEVELAEQYNVSRITLRQSIAELEKDGI